MKVLRRALALALPLVVLTACASSGEMDTGQIGDGVAVEVENNLIPPTSLTVYLVSSTGTRDLLGNVPPGQTDVLAVDAAEYSGEYQLIAETTAGQDLRSRPFTVTGATGMVEWDVSSNMVSVRGP